ncbi:MAG: rhodanese-like domain-containing protein [Pseudomonadota bacterium]|nr:rhodanese-like domain-containing protein [Pseudomonadota bacterium]
MRLFLLALALFSFNVHAVDPATLSKEKISKLGLYIEAKDIPAFLEKHGKNKVLFLDLRTPEELLFVGVPDGIDGSVPFGIMHYDKWDEKKSTYVRNPNPDFLSQFELRAMDKGSEKSSPILFICRSGDRSALGADFLARHGYTNVWSVVDGFEGDTAKDGPNKGKRTVNGWKNIGLPWSYKLDKDKVHFTK